MQGSEDEAQGISDDELPAGVDLNDPYFKEEMDKMDEEEAAQRGSKSDGKKKKKKRKKKGLEETNAEDIKQEQVSVQIRENHFKLHFLSRRIKASPIYRKTMELYFLLLWSSGLKYTCSIVSKTVCGVIIMLSRNSDSMWYSPGETNAWNSRVDRHAMMTLWQVYTNTKMAAHDSMLGSDVSTSFS